MRIQNLQVHALLRILVMGINDILNSISRLHLARFRIRIVVITEVDIDSRESDKQCANDVAQV